MVTLGHDKRFRPIQHFYHEEYPSIQFLRIKNEDMYSGIFHGKSVKRPIM